MSIGEFQTIVRHKWSIQESEGIFFFIDNCLYAQHRSIGSIYNEVVGTDNMDYLHIHLETENTFGSSSL